MTEPGWETRDVTYVVGVNETAIIAMRRAEWSVENPLRDRPPTEAVDKALGASGPRPHFEAVRLWPVVAWAKWRQAAQRLVDVAARAGVSHQRVSCRA